MKARDGLLSLPMSEDNLQALPEPEEMKRALSGALPQFRQIQWVRTIASTNASLMELARADRGQLARPWLLGAHLQEQGRGRSGRSWQNREGANLMFSCATQAAHAIPAGGACGMRGPAQAHFTGTEAEPHHEMAQ
jgi:hypothetical protein